ncbi:MAG TPA: hypothetical protein VNG33_10975, partial [Polyangiaceae bacterium]|nr:hypothetical protein [Polyangiaceae bacterium]
MRLATQTVATIFSVGLAGIPLACSGASNTDAGEPLASSTAAIVTRPDVRLLLTPSLLTRLKARASAADPAWVGLKTQCDGFASGTMNAPSANAYPDFPNVG